MYMLQTMFHVKHIYSDILKLMCLYQIQFLYLKYTQLFI